MSQDAYETRRFRDPHDPVVYIGGSVEYVFLHADTEPEAIAAVQRHEVRLARRKGLRTVEEISEYVILPVSIVRRRMEEIDQPRE